MFCLLFHVSSILAQHRQHTVTKGQTITQIAQQYRITPYDIYRLNPEARNGIRENDVLIIPSATAPEQRQSTTHTVKAKETLFSISRQYDVPVDALRQANPQLVDGLKTGQVITIPGSSQIPVGPSQVPSKPVFHIVEAKETKFGIAKRYGLTVAELERMNPGIEHNLPVGYRLVLGTATSSADAIKPKPTVTEIYTPATTTTEVLHTTKRTPYANYEVKPQETMYSLTKMFELTEEELIRLNPILKDGVKVGMILKVPGKGSITIQKSTGFEDLTQSVSTGTRKQLVMLFPFNAGKIKGDTAKSVVERLKKDAFLNMTLDFYSGALMAIDSAKALGLNLDIRIYDSQESRSSSEIASVISRNNVAGADAVIGPFYQQYAEEAAQLLTDANVPVISPLSKEAGKALPNLFQSMPSPEVTRRAMMDYMMVRGGNIIFVADPKKVSNREFITLNYPAAKYAEVSEAGTLNADDLRAKLVKGVLNFVVLDTEKTGMILSTTNVLLNEMANHQIQLAIIEPNETLDFEEISMKRLTILKMLQPSLTRPNSGPEAMAFENAYRKVNKIFPNQYAVRGFDVTFDTILRLVQDKGFATSAMEDATQQMESKFKYMANGAGFINKGVYILQYNDDLTVTEAN